MNEGDKLQAQHGGTMAYRQTAKAVILDVIHRHKRRADEIQILHDSLPETLTKEQDDAIWSIACSLPRP